MNDELRVLVAVVHAMAMGGVIGLEREMKERPAGFRTHMLVGGAAAFLVGAGWLAVHKAMQFDPQLLQLDPLRLIEAVVAGVAFIGAGTIFARRDRDAMVGITTAASLLMVAAIGIASGLGFYLLATATTVLTLVVLGLLRRLEKRLGTVKGSGPEDRSATD